MQHPLPLPPGVEHPQDEVKVDETPTYTSVHAWASSDASKINAVNSGSDSCTGIGVVAGFAAVVFLMEELHGRHFEANRDIQLR